MPQPLNDAHSARRQLTQLRRHELERSKLERAEAANAAATAARRQALLHSQKARQQLALEAPPPVALGKNKSSPRSAARVLDALRFKVAEKQQALAKLQATEAELGSLLSPRPSSGRAASQARLELQEARRVIEARDAAIASLRDDLESSRAQARERSNAAQPAQPAQPAPNP